LVGTSKEYWKNGQGISKYRKGRSRKRERPCLAWKRGGTSTSEILNNIEGPLAKMCLEEEKKERAPKGRRNVKPENLQAWKNIENNPKGGRGGLHSDEQRTLVQKTLSGACLKEEVSIRGNQSGGIGAAMGLYQPRKLGVLLIMSRSKPFKRVRESICAKKKVHVQKIGKKRRYSWIDQELQ